MSLSWKKWFAAVTLVFIGGLSSAQTYDFVVAKGGNADFSTVQGAINAVPDMRKNTTIIFIKNGVYKEKLILPASKTNVRFVGESGDSTILMCDDFAGKKNRFGEEMGTSGSSCFFVFGDGFSASNITFANTAGPVGQAVAVRVEGDRVSFDNCRFLGFQDTLYPYGKASRQYYKNCYIEGTTDFIFGWSTAFFEDCEIFCKKGGHYITAASTEQESPYGFVFKNCRITGDAPQESFYLGRPWRPYAKTVFINCSLGPHIKAEGWHNWDKPDAERTAYYAELGSYGPGADPRKRVSWSYQLDSADLTNYTIETVLAGWDPKKTTKNNQQ